MSQGGGGGGGFDSTPLTGMSLGDDHGGGGSPAGGVAGLRARTAPPLRRDNPRARLRWYRFTRLALDVVPEILRGVFRARWEARHGVKWTEDAASGRLLVEGGAMGGSFDVPLPGTFTLKKGKSRVFTTDDITALLPEEGMPVEFGGFLFTVARVIPPKVHTGGLHEGGHFEKGQVIVESKHEGDDLGDNDDVAGRTASKWVPRAVWRDNKALDKHVKASLATGLTAEWDTTALRSVLLGIKGCMLAIPPADINDAEFWDRVGNGTLVGGGSSGGGVVGGWRWPGVCGRRGRCYV